MSKKLTVSGVLQAVDVQVSQQGTKYAKATISYSFFKKDGQIQVISQFGTIFNDYLIGQINNGYFPVGCVVEAEGSIAPDTYSNKNGEVKVDEKFTINSMTCLNLHQMFQVGTQQTQQVQQTQPVVQQPVNNQVQQGAAVPMAGVNSIGTYQTMTQPAAPQQPGVQQPAAQAYVTNPNYSGSQF